jgi:phosphatidylinositol alpha-mannosyltransferase
VENANLSDVVFTGGVDFKDLPCYYKTADIFCAPATGHESFGIVLLEAMATGKPVVATSIPGYASVVTHGSEGLLAPPKQEVPLAQALASMIKNEEMRHRMGEKGRKKAAEYGWEQISRKVMDLYTRTIINNDIKE